MPLIRPELRLKAIQLNQRFQYTVSQILDLQPVRGMLTFGFAVLLAAVFYLLYSTSQKLSAIQEKSDAAMNAREGLIQANSLWSDLTSLQNSNVALVLNLQNPITRQTTLDKRSQIEQKFTMNEDLVITHLTRLSLLQAGWVETILPGLRGAILDDFSRQAEIRKLLWTLPDQTFVLQARPGSQEPDSTLPPLAQPMGKYRELSHLVLESEKFASRALRFQQQLRTEWNSQIRTYNEEIKELSKRVNIQIGIAVMLLIVLLPIMIVIFLNDLNRKRVAQQRLEKEKDLAQELAEVKQRFLANMSHEIRNPLHAIIGFAEQLAQTELARNQRHLLVPLRRSARYLLALINDVLDYSKIDTDNLRLEKSGFSLPLIFEEVESTFHSQAQSKGIELLSHLAESVPAVVLGDSLRLRQMLLNLVGNAIKFTETGNVKFSVKADKITSFRADVIFTVEDTGIGIPETLQQEIFSEWTQADNRTTRRYGGTGLGLAITRRLAELHGGTISLTSREGVGTTIVLRIPYELGTEKDLEEQSIDTGNRISWKGKRVLVADDEPFNRMLMETLLHRMEIETVLAENGKQALELLRTESLHLGLVDLQMPEMDGFMVARLAREANIPTPLIAVTATATKKETDLAREMGMKDILLKPFEEKDLARVLARTFTDQPTILPEGNMKPAPASEAAALPDDTGYHLDHLRKLTGNQPRAMKALLEAFLRSADAQLLALDQALKQHHLADAAAAAHRLAPACRHLGLEKLTLALKDIELNGAELDASGRWESTLFEVIDLLKKSARQVRQDLASLVV